MVKQTQYVEHQNLVETLVKALDLKIKVIEAYEEDNDIYIEAEGTKEELEKFWKTLGVFTKEEK